MYNRKVRKESKKTKRHTQDSVSCACSETHSGSLSGTRLLEIGGMLLLIAVSYKLLSLSDLTSWSLDTESAVGLGTVFLIGITASASSCLAMVGGLLLSISANWSEAHPRMSARKKFAPLLQFNLGRIGGYFILGGLTGLLGKSLILSVQTTGYVKVILALVMVLLGLKILRLTPKVACSIPLPKALWNRLRGLQDSDSVFAPALLGAVTYFVPCGFTQSMQLLALGSGNFWAGAAIMTVFALGTLPALLGISAASTAANGKIGRLFFTFAGTLSVFLGMVNIESGLALTGLNLQKLTPRFSVQGNAETDDPNVTIDKNGQQVISVEVQNSGYSNNSFVINPDVPTWIYATAKSALSGCISSMAIPDFNVSTSLHKGENWIGPIKPKKDFAFMCSMGMFRADVRVRS